MGNNELGNELAARFEAMNWFMLDLADELVASGCIDKQRLLARLRHRSGPVDQLEYLRLGRERLDRLAEAFEEDGPTGGRRPGA